MYSYEALTYVVTLINGKLRTPKAYQIHLIIDMLNKTNHTRIQPLPKCVCCFSKNAWLAGFIDAEGSFNVRQTLKTAGIKKRQVECKFVLTQQMTYPKTGRSYEPLHKWLIFCQ